MSGVAAVTEARSGCPDPSGQSESLTGLFLSEKQTVRKKNVRHTDSVHPSAKLSSKGRPNTQTKTITKTWSIQKVFIYIPSG